MEMVCGVCQRFNASFPRLMDGRAAKYQEDAQAAAAACRANSLCLVFQLQPTQACRAPPFQKMLFLRPRKSPEKTILVGWRCKRHFLCISFTLTSGKRINKFPLNFIYISV
jgi:hypothetical protein